MKNLFLLLIAIFLISCKSDDDSAATSKEEFIGSWTLSESYVNEVEIVLGECEKMETLTVKADETFVRNDYVTNVGPCGLVGSDEGTWENLGSNKYKLIVKGELYEYTILFSENSCVMTNEEDGYIYKDVFVKDE